MGPASIRIAACAFTAALAFAGAAHAARPAGVRAEGAFDEGEPRVEARLLLQTDGAPDGHARAGVLFELDPGWHLYWRNPGESGLPTRLRFSVDGGEAGPVAWPAPRAFREDDGLFTTYGYEGRVLLTSELALPGEGVGERWVRVEADLLVCETRCLPATLALARRLDLPDADAAATRALFAQFGRRVPRAPEALGLDLAAWLTAAGGAALDIRGSDGLGGARAEFFPDGPGFRAAGRETPGPGALRVALERSGDAAAAEPRLAGVLTLRDARGGARHVRVDLPLRPEPAGLAAALAVAARALLLAFLGGLLLNAMPCVLPVLAIKVVAIAQLAHRGRREVLLHGAAYTAGVLSTMALLAAAVCALRAAGTAVGWGFQFQEPGFVAAIGAVLVFFACNLFGVFEIQFQGGRLARLGEDAAGPRRSFFEGLLAVVLATPCSAPFLGTAVGFAFASGAAATFGVFLCVGLGLAAPFALVTMMPGWARFVPRAGAWMITLRRGLGFALLGTVVWLLWIVGRSLGSGAVSLLLAFLLALAFAAWLYGELQRAGRGVAAVCAAVLALALGAAGVSAVRALPTVEPAGTAPVARAWERFDRAAVARELGRGRPVFAYFTADWCITCKWNERVVLSDERVHAELARLDVAVFRGDWTRRDEAIRRELARLGKAGVPVYAVYRPDAPGDPLLLPELLDVDGLVAALRDAARGERLARR